MDPLSSSPSSTTSGPSTGNCGEASSTLCAEGTHASHGARPANASELQTPDTSGPRCSASSPRLGRGGCSQRTFRWPHSPNHGETFEGWATESRQLSALVLETLGRHTSETDGGCLLPTPTASNTKAVHLRSGGRPPRSYLPTPTVKGSHNKAGLSKKSGDGLATWVRRWPTPTARDWRSGKASAETLQKNSRPLSEQIGGLLNPTWVEWLMGFPLGFTVCAGWETRKSRSKRQPRSPS